MNTLPLKRPIGGGGSASEFWTVRDQYASTAMGEFIAGTKGLASLSEEEIDRQFALVAKFAFMLADAMMKARA